MRRDPILQMFIDKMAKEVFGWDGDPNHCKTCNGDIGKFDDELSETEFEISGMCQKCQNETFTIIEDEDE